MHGLFIFLVVVAGVSFTALLFTGPRALWSAWHTRRQSHQAGLASTSESKSKSKSKETVPPPRQRAMPSSSLQKPDPPRTRSHSGNSGSRPVFAGTTTPPQPRHSSAAGLNRPEEPALRSLPELRDRKRRLSVLLEEIDMRPDGLDVMARDVHETLVMPAYELMHTEAAKALGSQWGKRDQDRFGDTYHAAASKWPAYREALRQSRGHGTSTDDAMVRLEGPRSAYIAALSGFYDAFSSTLDIFFPSLPDRCRGSYILWSSSLDDPR